jgi:hypothetical protein
MSNLVHNEQVKLRASFLNNLSVGITVTPYSVPNSCCAVSARGLRSWASGRRRRGSRSSKRATNSPDPSGRRLIQQRREGFVLTFGLRAMGKVSP